MQNFQILLKDYINCAQDIKRMQCVKSARNIIASNVMAFANAKLFEVQILNGKYSIVGLSIRILTIFVWFFNGIQNLNN